MPNVPVTEGTPFTVSEDLRAPLRQACGRIQQQLTPSFAVLEEAAGAFTVRGVVGTIFVRPGTVLDVTPKVQPDDDWIGSVLDLLLAPDRIEIAGDRRAGFTQYRNLLEVLAGIYAERLTRALRRDGPIMVIEPRRAVLPVLKGKLDVTAWARRALWEPHRFPVSFQELTADNEFSRALAWVASLLARGTRDPRIRASLLFAMRSLRPGAPDVAHVGAHVGLRRLPAQWSTYEPAWDVAASVLTRRSLLGTVGSRHGVSIAIEAWPLLERLLERALAAAVRSERDSGRVIVAPAKRTTRLLRATPQNPAGNRGVIPDGRLLTEHGDHIATFEAKYADYSVADGPPREHIFQALSTAAACGSPTAVLVYPGAFDAAWWEVCGFHGMPAHLATIGLGLFSYRRGSGDIERAQRLLAFEAGPPVATPSVPVSP